MAWTSLSFAYGSVLTSTKMTQVYDNFAYGAGSTDPTFVAPALGTPVSGVLTACTGVKSATLLTMVAGATEQQNIFRLEASTGTPVSTEFQHTGTSYVEAFNCHIRQAGVYRVYMTLKTGSVGNQAYGLVYKNGVSAGVALTTTSETYATQSDEVTFAAGDTLQVFTHGTSGVAVWVKDILLGSVLGNIVSPVVTLPIGAR